MSVENGNEFANKLNNFYSRFDVNCTPELNSKLKHDNFSSINDDPPSVCEKDTSKVLKFLKINKAHGLDNISPKLLKLCHKQLAVPFTISTQICNQSLKQNKCPVI